MTKIILEPTEALNDAFKKVNIDEDDFNSFKTQLKKLIAHIDNKRREEFHKTLIRDFLNATYYGSNHSINSKDDNDLVIHNGRSPNSGIGVIMETKRPGNHYEMPANGSINKKGLQELVLYFLRERITKKENEIKHLVVTNVEEWFIFDAQVFDKAFFHDKALKKKFLEFENKKLSGTTTNFFYTEIAAPAIEKNLDKLTYAYFRLSDYEKYLEGDAGENELIILYKLLSPEHLLKLDYVNDSNTLNKRFYSELLHIIGLTEVRKGGKKLIERKKEGQRDSGSLIENTIHQLDAIGKVSRMEGADGDGASYEDRLFHAGLELCICWINRILFLKLLEGQLIKYHDNNKSHSFLNIRQVPRFGELNALFFSVLARKPEERSEYFREKFAHVPYLNSSLFELSEVEDKNILISNLFNERKLPLFGQTVLRQPTGKRKTGEMNTLEYLFSFLDAYDFASEGKAIIQKAKKSMISASVLGLIFEKINGYKDGSFFTPGFITMYMCRETIRKAVLQKFREAKGWDYDNLKDLHNKIEPGDIEEANEIVNSLKICDPAVGSGHFLVSALNEIIATKQELGILTDKHGNRLHHYTIKVANDELEITGYKKEVFEYRPGCPESQRVQETLFHEKQTIIENCLFGVDINPNSVNICRLRLWIELLKNAYYKEDTGFKELETLPNIDINIKCGNSLVSRFKTDDNLRQIARSTKWSIASYQNAVEAYKRSHEKEDKQELERLINRIKSNYVQTIQKRNPALQKLQQLKRDYEYKFPENGFFVNEPESTYGGYADKIENEKQRLIAGIEQLENELEAEKRFFETHNAFEWRFEFPEVLNDDGDFVGFDIVIGNPPYIRQEGFSKIKSHLKERFDIFHPLADILTYFVELGYNVLKKNGVFQFIVSGKFTRAGYGSVMRNFLSEKTELTHFIDFGGKTVFVEATVDAAILGFNKRLPENNNQLVFREVLKEDVIDDDFTKYIRDNAQLYPSKALMGDVWSFHNPKWLSIIEKINRNGTPLSEWDININRGVLTGYNPAFIINKEKKEQLVSEDPNSGDIIKPLLRGRDIQKYLADDVANWLIYIPWHFPLHGDSDITGVSLDAEKVFESDYRFIYRWLKTHYNSLSLRNKAETGIRYEWYAMQRFGSNYWQDFEKPKLVWKRIGSILRFCYDESGAYCLDSTCIATGKRVKYLTAVLNSTLCNKELFRLSPKTGTGDLIISVQALNPLRVPIPNEQQEKEVCGLLDNIIELKKKNRSADTIALERKIDQLVYQLYDLTDEEIQIIENS